MDKAPADVAPKKDTPKPPPRKKPSGAANRRTSKAKATEARKRVASAQLELLAGACNAIGALSPPPHGEAFRLDAETIRRHLADVSAGLATAADDVPALARWLDASSTATGAGAILSTLAPIVVEIATNHMMAAAALSADEPQPE